ncbi:hypothetical protein SADUNF_Sadunf02G0018100 [Salix dunnii]|uniref:Uncharacterized protein n=1 Tax=Salix dunnii TaxID=1413687 RepID=A0A835TFQ7_9ROSI|nr:hypothetical protein SADUNF_Sadunf02G0018100 [Salix dunnii]
MTKGQKKVRVEFEEMREEDCDVLGGQDNQRTIRGVCYDGTQSENAKVGEKRRLMFSVHGMIEKKENGMWREDNAEVLFLGGAAGFCCKIYCQTAPAVCSTSDERFTTCLESPEAREEADVQIVVTMEECVEM